MDFWIPQKTWKSTLDGPPWNPRTLGPCPDDRAQNSVLDSLNESSVRPNSTLFFSKIRSQFSPRSLNYFFRGFLAPLKNMKIHPGRSPQLETFWEPFGTPWGAFGAPLDAKWRWRPSCGVTPSFATETSKLAEASIKKWKGGPQNSNASNICFEKA